LIKGYDRRQAVYNNSINAFSYHLISRPGRFGLKVYRIKLTGNTNNINFRKKNNG